MKATEINNCVKTDIRIFDCRGVEWIELVQDMFSGTLI